MQLYFIRHGQSANNALFKATGTLEGRTFDPELTDAGKQQAQYLSRFLGANSTSLEVPRRDLQNLSGYKITDLYCSLMVRSVATACIVASYLGLPVCAWTDLHEEGGLFLQDPATGMYVGQAGNNRSFFTANYPELILPENLGDTGWWNRPFEQLDERVSRAQRFVQTLIERHGESDDRVAVISHGDFYNRCLGVILNIPVPETYWFGLNNVAITRVDFLGKIIELQYMNRVDFLPRALVT